MIGARSGRLQACRKAQRHTRQSPTSAISLAASLQLTTVQPCLQGGLQKVPVRPMRATLSAMTLSRSTSPRRGRSAHRPVCATCSSHHACSRWLPGGLPGRGPPRPGPSPLAPAPAARAGAPMVSARVSARVPGGGGRHPEHGPPSAAARPLPPTLATPPPSASPQATKAEQYVSPSSRTASTELDRLEQLSTVRACRHCPPDAD